MGLRCLRRTHEFINIFIRVSRAIEKIVESGIFQYLLFFLSQKKSNKKKEKPTNECKQAVLARCVRMKTIPYPRVPDIHWTRINTKEPQMKPKMWSEKSWATECLNVFNEERGRAALQ